METATPQVILTDEIGAYGIRRMALDTKPHATLLSASYPFLDYSLKTGMDYGVILGLIKYINRSKDGIFEDHHWANVAFMAKHAKGDAQ